MLERITTTLIPSLPPSPSLYLWLPCRRCCCCFLLPLLLLLFRLLPQVRLHTDQKRRGRGGGREGGRARLLEGFLLEVQATEGDGALGEGRLEGGCVLLSELKGGREGGREGP